jgi:hypothetical protein
LGGLSFTEFGDDVGADSWNDDGDGIIGDGEVESAALPNERKSVEGRTKSLESAKTQSDPKMELYDLAKTNK